MWSLILEMLLQKCVPNSCFRVEDKCRLKVYGKDGLEESYVEQPHHPELNKKFSFEIQKATLNKKIKNLNFADLYVERWDEQQSLFISDIIVDVSKEPPIIRKKSDEAGSYNGRYSYEIGGKQFSENVRGSIPNYNN